MITGILGGVGLFLVGIVLLTDGVKAAAGDAFRAMIQRFARGPGTAFVSGAAVTALVQSSSATTLATIGFVSAGLLTFPQAVGVILGANVGTTSTGWLVSVIGFKVSLSAVAYPLVGLGALARLLGKGRVAHAGLALAGFGLIFVGIEVLQVGLASLATQMDPSALPGATLAGRAGLVLFGIAMTIVMQSSSAAVATTLTGLHAGTLGLEQAALLVIGQNLGTSAKAALASIGGSVSVKRTALAHILFNGMTGVIALAAFPLLLAGALRVAGEADPEIALALFHTTFNVAGVAILFPFLRQYARVIERIIPERGPVLTRYLDPAVAEIPSVALEAVRRSASAVSLVLFGRTAQLLTGEARRGRPEADATIEPASHAVWEIRRFLGGVRTPSGDGGEYERHLSLLHATDHLERFIDALRTLDAQPQPEGDGAVWKGQRKLAHALTSSVVPGSTLAPPATAIDAPGPASDAPADAFVPDVVALEGVAAELAELRKVQRARVLERTARGEVDPENAWDDIEAVKTMDRLGYHAWRTAVHLQQATPPGSRKEDSARDADQVSAKASVEQELRTTDAKSGTSRKESDSPAS